MVCGRAMNMDPSTSVQREPRHILTFYGVVLFTLLACLYLLLYRGHPLSIDEISTFDSVESLTQHGILSRTIEFYRQPSIAADGTPFLPPLYEPLQIIAASPFYLFAQSTPQLGQFHAVFLLNVFVTALTGVSLFIIGLRQGYRTRTAWLGGFIFGTATLALPYSRWLFREPLMSLFALWAFALAFEIRQRMKAQQTVGWQAAALVASVLAMLLTKQIGLVFVPGILISLTPPVALIRRFLPVIALLAGVLLLFLVALLIVNPDFGDDRYSVSRWLNPANLGLSHMAESALGYQISPARSFWLYSPVLLFAFAGGIVLLKREMKWLVIGIALTFLLSSAAYGALRLGAFWSGGWGWGPRYMLPMVPLAMLLVLPVIDREPIMPRRQRIAFAGVLIASLAIQFVGIAVPYTDFYNRYYLPASVETSWLAQNWSWQNPAIAYHLRHFSLDSLDSAWRFARPLYAVPLYLLGLIGLTIGLGHSIPRRALIARPVVYGLCFVLIALVTAGSVLGLYTLRYDSRYLGSHRDVYDLVQGMNTLVSRDDAVILSGSEYMVLFMNWFKAGAIYLTLPDDALLPPPATPQVAAAEAFGQVAGPETHYAADWTARHSRNLWLVMSPSAYREGHGQWYKRYFSAIAYPAAEYSLSPFAETVQFATGSNITFRTVEITPPASFGEQLALTSASLPEALDFDAGDSLPFTLRWTPVQPLDENYQISVQIHDADGVLVAQRDTMPQNSYGATSNWQPGTLYEDRHAIVLPSDLPPGEYSVNIVVYRLDTLERLAIAGDSGDQIDAYTLTTFRVR
jgi:hypothetical protein